MFTLKHAMKHNWLRIFTIVLLIGLLLPSGFVLAQDSSPHSRREEALKSGMIPLSDDSIEKADIESASLTQVVQDGSFEAFDPGTRTDPYWTASDSYFDTPLCNSSMDDCGAWDDAHPYNGFNWAWFGGTTVPATHTASLSQTVTFPACGAGTLKFYLWIGYAEPGSGTDDVFYAKVDGTPVFSANATQASLYSSYTLISVDVSAFAPGASHTLQFSHKNTAQNVGFHLDDVSLEFSCITIAGNAGAPGAVLSYTDGTTKSTVAGGDGSYSLPVSNNWSGTVIPSHPCYTFTPPSKTYNNVMADLSGENYTATFNNAAVCAVTAGVFRPTNGALYLKNSNATGFADIQINYGLGGDYPITGDWNGDGIDTIGIYRNGYFYLRNSNTIGFADIVFSFGMPGDQPVAGDWNNDGIDSIGIYRNGVFYLRNLNTTGMPELTFALGVPGDVGIAGDWDGDGVDTTGVFRPSNGALYLKSTNATGYADVQINYGQGGDRPVTGDWNNDGTDTIGVYRNGSFYLRNSNTIGFADIVFALGVPGDMPIAGNWDGKP